MQPETLAKEPMTPEKCKGRHYIQYPELAEALNSRPRYEKQSAKKTPEPTYTQKVIEENEQKRQQGKPCERGLSSQMIQEIKRLVDEGYPNQKIIKMLGISSSKMYYQANRNLALKAILSTKGRIRLSRINEKALKEVTGMSLKEMNEAEANYGKNPSDFSERDREYEQIIKKKEVTDIEH